MYCARQFLCDRTASLETLRTCAALISAAQLDVVAEFLPVLQKGDESASLPVIGRVPTLIIAGARDRLTPLSHTTALTRGIPKSRLIRIPDCGHMAPMEKPEIVNRHLAEMMTQARTRRLPLPDTTPRPSPFRGRARPESPFPWPRRTVRHGRRSRPRARPGQQSDMHLVA